LRVQNAGMRQSCPWMWKYKTSHEGAQSVLGRIPAWLLRRQPRVAPGPARAPPLGPWNLHLETEPHKAESLQPDPKAVICNHIHRQTAAKSSLNTLVLLSFIASVLPLFCASSYSTSAAMVCCSPCAPHLQRGTRTHLSIAPHPHRSKSWVMFRLEDSSRFADWVLRRLRICRRVKLPSSRRHLPSLYVFPPLLSVAGARRAKLWPSQITNRHAFAFLLLRTRTAMVSPPYITSMARVSRYSAIECPIAAADCC
jgi:hypothetical protein